MALTPEQLEMRKTGIGASEAPMVLGESPHGGRIALYMRKKGLAVDESTPATEMGNILEAGVAEYYARKTGAKLEPTTTLRHPEHPFVLATPDFFVNDRRKLLQIKCVGQWMAHHWKDDDDGIPDYVRIQVTQEMDVAGVPICDVAALICGTDVRIYQVEYDAELAAYIREADRAFWFDHVLADEIPEVDGSDDAATLIKRLYPFDRTPMLDATVEMEEVASALMRARHSASRWTAEQTLLEQRFKTLLGDAEGAKGAGWKVTWRASAAGVRSFLFKAQGESKSRKAA